MTSYKITVIATMATALASSACPRPQSNYCADVSDHNCMDRDASLPSEAPAPPKDAPPDMNTRCTSDAECPNGACYLATNGTGSCVQCTLSNSNACTDTTPICGTDHKCRICTAHVECDTDACLPSGMCAKQLDVAYASQVGRGDCSTKDMPCADLQSALNMHRLYVRVSGSLTTANQTTIDRGVTIFGDTGSELVLTGNLDSVLKISFSNSINNDPTNNQNAQVAINNLRITQINGKDSIQVLGQNSIVKLTHVSIDGGSGNGINTNDYNNPVVSATNPNILLTDVAIRQKDSSGIHAIGGQLTIVRSAIFANTIWGIHITSSKLLIDQSKISNNNQGGVFCGSVTPGDVTISANNVINNHEPQISDGCTP